MQPHPHCTITVSRSLAPGDKWHWRVDMPDGHCFDVKGGFATFPDAMADAATNGGVALLKADAAWRGCKPNSLGDHPNGRA